MQKKSTFRFLLLSFNLRKELRLALLAAMETCWVFAILAFLATMLNYSQPLAPLPFFLVYWLALVIGRILPGTQRAWIVLQIATVLIAFVAVVIVARVEIYATSNLFDLAWLPQFASNLLGVKSGFVLEHIVSIGTIFVIVRGLQFAQRPLTLWFIGYEFRLGIVAFFGLYFVAAFVKSYANNPLPWLLIYFFLSLVAIALARIDEMNNEIKFSTRWIVTLIAAVALVLFCGIGLIQIFTLDTAQAILGLFAPLWWLISFVIIAVSIPLGYVLGWLIDFLRPLFQSMGTLFNNLQLTALGNLMQDAQNLGDAPLDPTIITVVKTIIVLMIVLLVGYWIARSLNRRMIQIENAEYARELIDDEETENRRPKESKKRSAARAHNPSADAIRRIYAALVAHAAQTGLPLRIAETPYDFEPRLAQHWTESQADIRAITQAYVSVHYGEQTATEEQVKQAKSAWEEIKRKT